MRIQRTIEIRQGGGRLRLIFIEWIEGRPKDSDQVILGPDDPVWDWSKSWIVDGHIPVAARTVRG